MKKRTTLNRLRIYNKLTCKVFRCNDTATLTTKNNNKNPIFSFYYNQYQNFLVSWRKSAVSLPSNGWKKTRLKLSLTHKRKENLYFVIFIIDLTYSILPPATCYPPQPPTFPKNVIKYNFFIPVSYSHTLSYLKRSCFLGVYNLSIFLPPSTNYKSKY